MKRIWLTILIAFLGLIGLSLAWFWRQSALPSHDAGGGSGSVVEGLSRGYHTAALLREFSDDTPEQALIVFQNDWELRPTGGFITALGEATIKDRALEDLSVVPSDYFDQDIAISAPMPAGLAYRISTPTLTLRDANWDVDFPTTAATLVRYYTDATGITPDIVVAITTKAAERMLELTGPLSFTVNGHVLEVTSQTVTNTLEDYTDQNFRDLGLEWETRKMVLSEFAAALLPRVQSLVTEHPIEALRLTNDLLKSYDIQAWSQTERIAKHLQALSTSQEVASEPDSDALLVVDTNVGARKTNRVIEQRIDYRIDLSASPARATLHINYVHTGNFEPTIIEYYDTLRVYVPQDASLISSEGLDVLSTYDRHGRTVFEGRHVVPPGESKTLTLEYTLPLAQQTIEDYKLLLERQPGAYRAPVQITVYDGQNTATIGTELTQDSLLFVEQ